MSEATIKDFAGWYTCSCGWTAYPDKLGKAFIEEHHAKYRCKIGTFSS